MLEKIKIAISLLRSRSYVVLTDTKAVVCIPLMDLDEFENIFMLSAQTSALQTFKKRLMEVIKEHDNKLKSMSK